MSVDIESIVSPTAESPPCGPDLSYDSEYIAVLSDSEGTPERQVGDEVIPAEEPKWSDIRDRCVQVLGRSKDLRVSVLLALALLREEGVQGFDAGLRVARELLEQYWDDVHPKLDPDDNLDPMERMNILAALAAPMHTYGDPMRFAERLMEAPLTNSRQAGRFSLRDIKIAAGDLQAPAGEQNPPNLALIEAAFSDTEIDDLRSTLDAAASAMSEVDRIDTILTEKAGAASAPDLSPVKGPLSEIVSAMQEQLQRRGYGSDEPQEASGESSDAPAPAAAPGQIASRDDVLRAIDRICDYYERHEPSSPVPLLLKRAQRLVSKSFIDIVKDLAPDSTSHVESLGGIASSGDE